MASFQDLARFTGRTSALPPIAAGVRVKVSENGPVEFEPEGEPQPISAFVCIIEYQGEARLITCRRYERIGEQAYVGAICHAARGYRQFRCDRIANVFDATTGEVIGDGAFFGRFSTDSERERAPTWGLASHRRALLVGGLNILAFMARCDGHWHPLEAEVIESFTCSLWLQSEWEGEPELEEIVAHSQRLSPDADAFFKALKLYAQNDRAARIMKRAVGNLIAADGEICAKEMEWGAEIEAFFRDYKEQLFSEHFQNRAASISSSMP